MRLETDLAMVTSAGRPATVETAEFKSCDVASKRPLISASLEMW